MGQSMQRGVFARAAVVSLICLGLGACLGAGLKNYKEGNKLRAAGKLDQAEVEYQKALDASPSSAKYQTAIEEVRAERAAGVTDLKREARSLEKQGQWLAASKVYAKALRLQPKNQDIAARAALSKLKSKNHGPEGWYRGVEKISQRLTGNPLVQRTLAGAKARAYQYHLRIANDLLDAGQGQKAWQEYELAKSIEPAMPGLDRNRYRQAEALDLAERADLRMATGDAVGAYELYRKSLDRRDDSDVASKMRRAKQQASRVLGKLESARAKADAGRWWQAVAEYDRLSEMDGVPSSVDAEAANARAEVVKLACRDARQHADKGSLRQAQGSILAAIKYSTLRSSVADTIREGLNKVVRGDPSAGRDLMVSSGAPASDPIFSASMDVAVAAAKDVLAKAQRSDPKAALKLLGKLGSFAKEMPEIKSLRRTLLKSNFAAMLDEALSQAKQGDDVGAAETLLDALEASRAPRGLRDAASDACAFLVSKKYVEAEEAFSRALAEAPRSRLAQRGLDIARLRRKDAERTALSTIESGGADVEVAVSVLEAARKSNPRNRDAKAAATVLLDRAERGANLDDLKIASLLGQAARLLETPAKARSAIDDANSALANADYAGAEEGYGSAGVSSPSSPVAKLGKKISRDRLLASLKSGATNVAGGSEDAARALAKLLAADPTDSAAKAALDALADRARAASSQGDDQEAARYVGFVVIATSPEPGLEEALSKGVDALASGQMARAEQSFTDADDMESGHRAAKLGLEIARGARLAGLQQALFAAKQGKNLEAMSAQLKRAIDLDADSKEARDAYTELLKAAATFGEKGEDRQAAALLDVANVVSRPQSAQQSITEANLLLADGKHSEAQAAYEKLSANAKSKLVDAGLAIAQGRIVQVLLAGVEKLEQGVDLTEGAEATAALLKLDSKNDRARGAVDKAIDRAEKAAQSGDQKVAVDNLRAASMATTAGSKMNQAIDLLDAGKHDEAEAAFAKLEGDLAKRASVIARMRKIAALKGAIGGDDAEAAKSIRALLEADPNDKEAQRGLQGLLDKAAAKGKAGDHVGSSEALTAALIASGLPEDLSGAVDVGITHMKEARFSEAEQSFGTALELAKDAKVAKVGHSVAKQRRVVAQQEAFKKIGADDPVPHARVLQASLLVDPGSSSVKRAYRSLLDRAKRAAKEAEDAELARVLDAAVLLENVPAEVAGAVTAADVKIAEKSFSDAEAMFAAVNESEKASEVAALGQTLVRARRVSVLKADLAAAEKEGAVLRASDIVGKILELQPNDRDAKRAAGKYGKQVVAKRLESAKAENDLGKLGSAHLYFSRVLKLEPKNGKAKAGIAEIEEALKKRLDLVVMVDPVGRRPGISSCTGLEAELRRALMKTGSSNNGLGMYMLDADWTEAVEEKAPDAPAVSGSFVVTIDKCENTSSSGSVALSWALKVPDAKGLAVVSGELPVDLPENALPRDEMDDEGKNVKRALGDLAAQKVIERLEVERADVDQWLLTLAEHGVKTKDAAMAADAYARLLVKKPARIDGKRAESVEKALAEVFE